MVAGPLEWGPAVWVASADPSPAEPQAPPEVPLDPGRTLFLDNPWILNPHATDIESWSRTGAGLSVNFVGGTPDCFAVHVTTQETPETVTVHMRGGTPPEAVGRMCLALAVDGRVDVPLQGPLGGRQVLATLDKRG